MINKQCPMCGEYIDVNAEVCEYCGYSFTEVAEVTEETNTEPTKEVKVKIESQKIIIGIVALFILAFGWLLATKIIIPSSTFQIDAPQDETEAPKQLTNSEKLKAGIKAFDSGNTEEAAEYFDQIIKSANDLSKAEAYYYMGNILMKRNLETQAVQSYEQAVAMRGDYIEPKKALLTYYIDKNNCDDDTLQLYMSIKGSVDKSIPEKIFNCKTDGYNMYYLSNKDEYKELAEEAYKANNANKSALELLMYYYDNKKDFKAELPYAEALLKQEYKAELANRILNMYYQMEYYTKALEILNVMEQHGSNAYQIERTRAFLQSKKEEYKNRNNPKPQAQTQTEEENDPYAKVQPKYERIKYVDENAW